MAYGGVFERGKAHYRGITFYEDRYADDHGRFPSPSDPPFPYVPLVFHRPTLPRLPVKYNRLRIRRFALNSPGKMPRTTSFKLTEDQETELLRYLKDRRESLESDNNDRIKADRRSWLAYEQSVENREQLDTIFEKSNLPLPITALAVEHFVSRFEDDILAVSPFFHFNPQGPGSRLRSEDYDRYFQWKMRQSGTRENLQDQLLPICVQRAAIFKSVYFEDVKEWIDNEARILHDRETGEPIEILGMGYVIEAEAKWLEVPDPIEPVDPETGEPNTRQQLAGDESFFFDPERHEWRQPEDGGVYFRESVYSGGKSMPVPSDAFYAPMNARTLSLQDTGVLLHTYDKPLSWAKKNFLRRRWFSVKDMEEYHAHGDAGPKTEGDQKSDTNEDLQFDKKDPTIRVGEFWVRRDVLGWGRPQEFVIFVDLDNDKAIYYEWKAIVCPDMENPFTAIAIGKNKNRWWGQSIPEKIEQHQAFIDKQFNSQAHRNELSANPIGGYNRHNTEEKDEDPEIYPGKVFNLANNKTISDVFTFTQLPNQDAKTQELIEFVIQLLQLWMGISNISQGDYDDLPSHSTATGVEATLREASKLGRRWMRRVIRGFEDHLSKLVKITMATLDEEEAFRYLEGGETHFGRMTPDDIRNMEIEVELVLSQNQGRQKAEAAKMALNTQKEYLATPDALKQYVRPLYEKILVSLGYDNTNELLPEVSTDAIIAQQAEQEIAKAGHAGEGPSGSASEQDVRPDSEPAPV